MTGRDGAGYSRRRDGLDGGCASLVNETERHGSVAVWSLARLRRRRRRSLVDAADHDGMDCAVVLTACSANRHRLTLDAGSEVARVHRPVVQDDAVSGGIDVVPDNHLTRGQRRRIRRE